MKIGAAKGSIPVDNRTRSRVIYWRGIYMPACPNCGRETLRTEDWVCQWCGYPLLSKSYKKLDKTFKEFQEERRAGWKSVTPLPPKFVS